MEMMQGSQRSLIPRQRQVSTQPNGMGQRYTSFGSLSRVIVAAAFPADLHCQDDAELCIAAHHAGVGLGRLFERIGFNHCADAG